MLPDNRSTHQVLQDAIKNKRITMQEIFDYGIPEEDLKKLGFVKDAVTIDYILRDC